MKRWLCLAMTPVMAFGMASLAEGAAGVAPVGLPALDDRYIPLK